MSVPNPFSDNATNVNPYASPAAVPLQTSVVGSADVHKLVKQFRTQMHSLGALWIIIGVLGFVVGVVTIGNNVRQQGDWEVAVERIIIGGVLLFLGALWTTVGILTCLKHMWAVYIGLVMCYIGLVVNVLTFSVSMILPLAIFGASILQSHRVIGWAKELKRQGIPLTTHPAEIETKLTLPM